MHAIGNKSRDGKTIGGGSEHNVEWHAVRMRDAFLANRDALLAEWMAAPMAKAACPSKTTVQQRAEKAGRKLIEWEGKLKRAQGMVKKWGRKVRYYEGRTP